jgi:carbonic anhydrase
MVTISVMLVLSSSSVLAWDYSNSGSDWVLSCVNGSNQSPININDDNATELEDQELMIYFTPFSGSNLKSEFSDNVWTAKRTDNASFGTINTYIPWDSQIRSFACTKFEVHAPSEHLIDAD